METLSTAEKRTFSPCESTDQMHECLLVLLIRLWTPTSVREVTARLPWCLVFTQNTNQGEPTEEGPFHPSSCPNKLRGPRWGPCPGPLLSCSNVVKEEE